MESSHFYYVKFSRKPDLLQQEVSFRWKGESWKNAEFITEQKMLFSIATLWQCCQANCHSGSSDYRRKRYIVPVEKTFRNLKVFSTTTNTGRNAFMKSGITDGSDLNHRVLEAK